MWILLFGCGPTLPVETGSGGDDTGAFEGPCPAHMAQLGDLCIDAFEATITGDLGASDQGAAWPDGSTTAVASSQAGVLPALHLSWYQAFAACENAGKHLCTVDEWQAACGSTLWPWGDAPPAVELCAVAADDGTSAWSDVQPTGSLSACRSPEGVFDQMGNAWEWADPLETGEDGRPIAGKLGGAYYAGGGSALCPAQVNTEHAPEFDGTIAARCCREARLAE